MRENASKNISKKILVAIAINELCRAKSLDSLSIDEICKKVHMSRSSFYRLFGDKYEIARWCQMQLLLYGVCQMGRTLTCAQGNTITLEGFGVFRPLLKSAMTMRMNGVIPFGEDGRQFVFQRIRETLTDCHDVKIDQALNFQIMWCTDASLLTGRRWINGDYQASAGEIGDFMALSFPDSLRVHFDDPTDPRPMESFSMDSFILSAMGESDYFGNLPF